MSEVSIDSRKGQSPVGANPVLEARMTNVIPQQVGLSALSPSEGALVFKKSDLWRGKCQ